MATGEPILAPRGEPIFLKEERWGYALRQVASFEKEEGVYWPKNATAVDTVIFELAFGDGRRLVLSGEELSSLSEQWLAYRKLQTAVEPLKPLEVGAVPPVGAT